MENINPFEILSYGVIGLGFLLAFLAFRLLSAEQKKASPNESILRAIHFFMFFSIALCTIGFGSEILRSGNQVRIDDNAQAGGEIETKGVGDNSEEVTVSPDYDYTFVITSGTKKNNGDTEAVDNLDKVGNEDGSIYAFAEFYGLEYGKEYERVVKVYNRNDEFIRRGVWKFVPTDISYWTTYKYDLDPEMDSPGYLTFKLFLDGNELTEKKILVADGKILKNLPK